MIIELDLGQWWLKVDVTYHREPFHCPTDRGIQTGYTIDEIGLNGDGLDPIHAVKYGLDNSYATVWPEYETDERNVAEFRKHVEDLLGDNPTDAARAIADKLALIQGENPPCVNH